MNRIEEEDENENEDDGSRKERAFWIIVFIELLLLKLAHGADENAGDLNGILFDSANETVRNGRVFRVQTKAFLRFKNTFQSGFAFEHDRGNFSVANFAFGIQHGDVPIENAGANHAVPAHA